MAIHEPRVDYSFDVVTEQPSGITIRQIAFFFTILASIAGLVAASQA